MINLRFHIVSIVAVFLALAIGLFVGSTLLDRATVEVLQGRQRSLDARNDELRAENDALRAEADRGAKVDAAMAADVLPKLLPGTMSDRPVLIMATKGIDEATVRATQASLRQAGASPLGIVWIDERLNLEDADSRAAAAKALGLASSAKQSAIVTAIADPLVAASRTAPDPNTTTTTAVDGSVPSTASTSSGDGIGLLVDAELVEWESPTEGEQGRRALPDAGMDLVVLGGEGAQAVATRTTRAIVRAVAERRDGVVIGEIRTPRSPADALAASVPARGMFVDSFRTDEKIEGRIVTVDDVDEVFGRLALVLAVGQLPQVTTGAYGSAASADRPFPAPVG